MAIEWNGIPCVSLALTVCIKIATFQLCGKEHEEHLQSSFSMDGMHDCHRHHMTAH